MKTFITTLFLVLASSVFSQTDQAFGDSLFNGIQSPNTVWNDWFITLEEYHRLIDRQELSKHDKDEFKLSINEGYDQQLSEFKNEMKELNLQYQNDLEEEVDITLTKVKSEPIEGIKRVFRLQLFVKFTWKKKTDNYILECQAAFIGNQWLLMEPLQEYFE